MRRALWLNGILAAVVALSWCLVVRQALAVNDAGVYPTSTNSTTLWCKLTDEPNEPNDPNTWSYDLRVRGVRTRSEAIRALCESGVVCEVMGHCWRDGRPGEGFSEDDGTYFSYTDYHPGVSFQTCRICGKTETRRWTDWD